nr:reverse transcriptase domain-containing protein [Tanacetum cinerariifolium]
MRTRSRSRHKIAEPLRIEFHSQEDQFQEDPPEVSMADNGTMAQLLQAPTVGYEDAIAIPEIAATNFELKHGLINLGAARIWLEKEPPRSILTCDDLVSKFINQFFPPSKTKNLRNEITRFQQRFDESFSEAWDRFNDLLRACPHHGFSELHQLDTFYNALNVNDQDSLNSAAGGNFLDKMPRECLKIIKSKSKVRQSRAKVVIAKVSTSSSTPVISSKVSELKDMLLLDKKNQSSAPASSSAPAPVKAIEPNCVTCTNYNQGNIGFRPQMVANQIRPLGFPPHQIHQNKFNRGNNFNQNQGGNFNQSNFNQGGNFNQGQLHRPPTYQAPAYQAPIPQTQSVTQTDFESYIKANDAVLRNMQSQGQGTLPSNTITNPKEDLKGITTRSGASYQGPTIPTQSKVVKQGTEVTKDQVQTSSSQSTAPVQHPVAQPETQTLVSEPVVAPVIVSIPYPSRRDNERSHDQANEQIEKFYEIFKEEKLSEMARTPMNEHCLAVILNKLPRKLGDPGKFLIPCEFLGMDECLALADLGANINLMPLSVWEGLSLLEFTLTCMTLELVDCSVSKPIGIAKDVTVKVGVFHFPADFVVVDFEPDPRVLLILRRCFLKTDRALINVHKGELTLHIENEAITYNLDQTVRYSANYNQMTANKTDVICEMYSQKVLGFSDVTASGSPIPYDDPIISTTSPTLTPFGDNDFLLFEEADAFLGLKDDPNSPEFNPFYYDPEGDILLLEAILNSEPLPPLPNHKQYIPSYKKELKVGEAETVKSSVDEPPEGINLEFYTHKILMKEDYKRAVQHQRRVNPKIHDVIKKEVEKLLDAGLIYPIFDSPWVIPVHCVPKKGGFTIIENEENELIPTCLVTEWRMLERLAGNEYYCFLDGFSGCFQIPIDLHDQEKTTFTYPYGTFAYRCTPFGLCNAPGTFQRCMLAIFHDMVEKTMEVFMDDFSIFGNSFKNCLPRLDKMLQRCKDTNLSLNWEKSHFMVKEGIVLGHKISKNGIEVDRAKVDVITKLPHPTTVKGIRSFYGHNTPFIFFEDCIKAFQMLKKKLTKAPILIAPNWDLPFELMCDANDFVIGAVLGQRHEKHLKNIHYASKTMNDVESNYTTTEKEMLSVVYVFKKIQSYLIMNKSIVHMDHSALKYLFAKKMRRRDCFDGFYYSKNLISKFLTEKEQRT